MPWPKLFATKRFVVNLLLGVTVLACSGTAHAWLSKFGANCCGGVEAVAVDASGDVFATGRAPDRFTVLRLAAATGAEVWRQDFTSEGTGHDVVLDATGDGFAVGVHSNNTTLVKFAGVDGGELWRKRVGAGNVAHFVTVDTSGDPIVGGGNNVFSKFIGKFDSDDGTDLWGFVWPDTILEVATDPAGDVVIGDIAGMVTKLDGADGAQLWQRNVSTTDAVRNLVVDGAGDVFVGMVDVVKLAGLDGSELWKILELRPSHMAIDAAGDLVVSRTHSNIGFRVRKLDGTDGAELWLQTFEEALESSSGPVAIDQDGNVVVAGSAEFAIGGERRFVAQLRGVDGARVWLRERETDLQALTVTPLGEAIVAGIVDDAKKFAVEKPTGPVSGKKLTLRDKASNPEARKLVMIARDSSLAVPLAPAGGDPTSEGATLRLVNPTTGEVGVIPLPASNWQSLGDPPTTKGYKYRDTARLLGPCQKVDVRTHKKLKVSCKGAQIPFTLDEPGGQGSLGLRLTLGSDALPYCVLFGGVRRDVPAIGSNTGVFVARGADPPASCLDVPSASGAFLDAGGAVVD